MTKAIEELMRTIKSLSDEQLEEFRACYREFDAQAWDDQFEADVLNGRLDVLADAALADYSSGRARTL